MLAKVLTGAACGGFMGLIFAAMVLPSWLFIFVGGIGAALGAIGGTFVEFMPDPEPRPGVYPYPKLPIDLV